MVRGSFGSGPVFHFEIRIGDGKSGLIKPSTQMLSRLSRVSSGKMPHALTGLKLLIVDFSGPAFIPTRADG